MKTVSRNSILDALHAVGVRPGDVLMLHSDLTRLGLFEGAKSAEETLAGYYEALRKAVGPEGTLVALSCTESWARKGTPFVYEDSPSEQGVLSEYIRTRPEAVRSLHPLFSVCAVGKHAHDICADASPSAFGYDSPFERMRRYDARILCLGVDLLAMTFVHHVEQTFGVPYSYTKEWSAPVYKNGGKLDRRFFAFVRYLESGVDYDFTRLQELLFAEGKAAKAFLGYGFCSSVKCNDVFETIMDRLQSDIFFLLRTAPDREPWKGPVHQAADAMIPTTTDNREQQCSTK